MKNVRDRTINVYSDSKSALHIIKRKKNNSKTVNELYYWIERLRRNNCNLIFTWIPAHTNLPGPLIEGNAEADLLTKAENARQCELLRNFHWNNKELKSHLRSREISKRDTWQADTHKVSKKFKIDKFLERNINCLHLTREEYSLLIRFMTGHACLAQQMKYSLQRDIITTQCRFCQEINKMDSSVHIIEDCNYFDEWRMRTLKRRKVDLEVSDLDMLSMLEFIKHEELSVRLNYWCDLKKASELAKEWKERREEENINNILQNRRSEYTAPPHDPYGTLLSSIRSTNFVITSVNSRTDFFSGG